MCTVMHAVEQLERIQLRLNVSLSTRRRDFFFIKEKFYCARALTMPVAIACPINLRARAHHISDPVPELCRNVE